MSADRLSAKEAALIAQARAQLGKAPAAPAVAPESATSAPAPDPAERLAALMAAARAESERQRERQRRLYLWAPLAFISLAGLWALVWMWYRL